MGTRTPQKCVAKSPFFAARMLARVSTVLISWPTQRRMRGSEPSQRDCKRSASPAEEHRKVILQLARLHQTNGNIFAREAEINNAVPLLLLHDACSAKCSSCSRGSSIIQNKNHTPRGLPNSALLYHAEFAGLPPDGVLAAVENGVARLVAADKAPHTELHRGPLFCWSQRVHHGGAARRRRSGAAPSAGARGAKWAVRLARGGDDTPWARVGGVLLRQLWDDDWGEQAATPLLVLTPGRAGSAAVETVWRPGPRGHVCLTGS